MAQLQEQWQPHVGDPRPVPPDQEIRVRYRNGVESDAILARERRWEAWPADIGKSDWDIVGWIIVSD